MNPVNVAIIGAGPAGCSAALYLAEHGYSCTLIEKDIFPREKTCGDALGGYAVSVLDQISPQLLDDFMAYTSKIPMENAVFYAPKFRKLIFKTEFKKRINAPESFICKRIDFDNFLADNVRKKKEIQFIEGKAVAAIKRNAGLVQIIDSNQQSIAECKLVIVANGMHSVKKNDLFEQKKLTNSSAIGIRAYFEKVKWNNDSDAIHIYFIKELLPGYLWIFPSTNGDANVGLATDSKIIKKRKCNLETIFNNALTKYPEIASRLKDSKKITPWKGHSIPLGTNFSGISGDNYLVTGDAAGIANPLTGEGIGESMYSGLFAAQQAIQAITQNNYSAKFLAQYNHKVYRKLGRLNKLYTIAQYFMRGTCRAEFFFTVMRRKSFLDKALKRIEKLNKG